MWNNRLYVQLKFETVKENDKILNPLNAKTETPLKTYQIEHLGSLQFTVYKFYFN